MADAPKPKSYNTILGDLVDTFLSKVGFKKIKVGGPLLSTLEASAQSQARITQDLFATVDSISEDRATGAALKAIAASENVPEIKATAASGFVNFSDTSFAKVSTSIYQGAAAPGAGTTALKVTDASSFPSSGNVYIGRGTVYYEGPLAYTSTTNVGPYWTINLSTRNHSFSQFRRNGHLGARWN
jgi:hypothetical protein